MSAKQTNHPKDWKKKKTNKKIYFTWHRQEVIDRGDVIHSLGQNAHLLLPLVFKHVHVVLSHLALGTSRQCQGSVDHLGEGWNNPKIRTGLQFLLYSSHKCSLVPKLEQKTRSYIHEHILLHYYYLNNKNYYCSLVCFVSHHHHHYYCIWAWIYPIGWFRMSIIPSLRLMILYQPCLLLLVKDQRENVT